MFVFQIAQRIVNPQIDSRIADLGGWNFLQLTIPRFITLGFIIAAVLFFFVFVIGGIQWITSGGDKGAIEDAKKKIVNAITGLVVLLLLYFIIAIINYFFGTSLGSVQFPPPISPAATVVPSVTPGSCMCDLGVPVSNNCNSPYRATCIGQFTCVCSVRVITPPPSCASQGGTCTPVFGCDFGTPLPSSDCPPLGQICCR